MTVTPATDALRADHREIEVFLDRLLSAAKLRAPDLVRQVREEFSQIQRRMRPHIQQEEKVFYPHLRASLPDVLDQMDEQHDYVREVEQSLDELLLAIEIEPTERQMTELIQFSSELYDTIQHHIADEEDVLLQLADAAVSAEEQTALAATMRQAAAVAQYLESPRESIFFVDQRQDRAR